MKLITVAWRNVGRNRRRTALSLGAIAVAALSIVFLFAYIAGMKADIVSNLINYYTGEVRLRHKDFEAFERFNPLHLRVQDAAETVQALSALDEVSAVSPRLSFPGAIFRDEQTLGLQGLGLDFDRERAYQDLSAILLSGTLPDEATPEGRRIPAALGRALAERLNLKIGDDFTVLATTMSRGNNAMTFEVTGLLEFPVGSLNGTTFIAPLQDIQRLVRMDDAVTDILIKSTPGYTPEETAIAVAAATARLPAAKDLITEPWTEIDTAYSMVSIAETVYGFVALFFFVLGSTVIINTIVMTIFERKQEIGTLAAMGMAPRELQRLFFYEAGIMSFLGSALGVLAGMAVVYPFSVYGLDLRAAMGDIDFQMSGIIYPQITLGSTVLVLVYSTVVALVAAYPAVRKVTKVEPVEALRGT